MENSTILRLWAMAQATMAVIRGRLESKAVSTKLVGTPSRHGPADTADYTSRPEGASTGYPLQAVRTDPLPGAALPDTDRRDPGPHAFTGGGPFVPPASARAPRGRD